jgi:hypothetical protein
VLPQLTEEAPLFVFLSTNLAECFGHFEFKTLLMFNSAFLQESIFFCTRPSNWSYVQSWHKREFFWDQGILRSAICFSSHYSSGRVPMSSAKVFFQEAHAQYWTLVAHQNEYYPQGSQWVEGC